MARPKTKTELIAAAESTFTRLLKLWDSLPAALVNATFPEQFVDSSARPEAHWKRDRNLRDVVVHLVEWHNLVLTWAKANAAGNPAGFFPEPYNWRNYAELNEQFTAQHRETAYEHARELLDVSHQKVMSLIDRFSDEELFTKRYFPWTGSTSLGSYLVSATSSHYEWAAKKTRAYLKSLAV